MGPSNNASSADSPKILLPGFGRPLNYIPSQTDPDYVGDSFGSALSATDFENKSLLPITTIREFMMLQFMNSITDKPEWHIKVNKPEITAKWKAEALASNHEDLTEKMIDYCLDELRYKSTLIPVDTPTLPPIVIYNGDVVKSDTALSVEFKEQLQQAVKAFEATIPEKLKDWHPGSDGKVWDLVHPSLFPLVYGRTRVLENGECTTLDDCIDRCSQGQTTQVPSESESTEMGRGRKSTYSRKFQWLPCEVDISGEEARITSYINNLHPQKEKSLYQLIEKLIDASIPLWNLTLAPLQRTKYFFHQLRIKYPSVRYDVAVKESQKPGDNKDKDKPKNKEKDVTNARNDDEGEDSEEDEDDDEDDDEDEDEDEDDEDDDDDDDDEDEDEDEDDSDTRPVIRPEPELPFTPLPIPPKFSLKDDYGKRGLQVIVKLANIELTPEKPEYDGGSWHIEGQMNEHIVATALYYYSNSNITPSTLSFRQWFSSADPRDIDYEQNKWAWLRPIYGCEQYGNTVQDVGGVETREGRLLTFPNILQHQVGPFKLADPTKPGHRKIIALFLVDPNIKVISTANVPCQQQEWWWERVADRTSKGVGLPRELQDHILKDVDFPISLQEAKALREELMEERKNYSFARSQAIKEYTISLCEH